MKTVSILLHLVPSQGDQSKLGGPEKSLSERSPGIGREERPPIVVVVHSLKQVLSIVFFQFTKYEWMYVMFLLYVRRVSSFSKS